MHLVCPTCAAVNRIADERLDDSPVCGKCGSELMALKPHAISEAAFSTFVNRTELPVLVDFWAAWCGPCRAMTPQFEQAARLLPQVRLIKVDSDAAPGVSQQFAIRSIPTLLLMRGGRELARQSGVMPAAEIVAWVKSNLSRRS